MKMTRTLTIGMKMLMDEEDHFERKLDAKGGEVRETLREAIEHSLAHWKQES